MRRAGFPEAVATALLGAGLAGAGFHAALLVFTTYDASRLVILAVGLFYASYLLLRAPRRDGRVLALTLWLLATGLTVVLDPPVLFYLLGQLLMFWLIRVLCHHRRLVHAVLDGIICGFSFAAAIWTFANTGSVAIACWSLLLCQALVTWLNAAHGAADVPDSELTARFDQARRGAEAALRRASNDPLNERGTTS